MRGAVGCNDDFDPLGKGRLVNGWIDPKVELPPYEDRYFIVYRHNGAAKIEKPYVADWIESEQRWSSLPRDCEVIYWQPVLDWPHESVSFGGRDS
jgi:hypothetical protein